VPFRAVLFDLGGVVFDSPMGAFAEYEERAGLPSGLIRGLNATNPDSNAWARLERGEIDVDGFVEEFEAEGRAAGHEVDGRAVLEGLSGEVRPEMVEALRRLRAAGLTVAALTNNIAPLADEHRPRWSPFLELFDLVVESSVERVRKPEPEFYQRALSRLGLDARECVYLDDLGINLKPAAAMGMHTIKVAEPEPALAELGDLLGLELM
jgi:putative hydrolase of the HAD superfamily